MDFNRLLSALPTPEDESEWLSVLGKLKEKATEFQAGFERLSRVNIDQSKYPDLYKEKEDLISRGSVLKSRILNVTDSVGGAWNWVKGAIGLDAVRDSSLGFVITIPIVALAAILALLVKWILDEKRLGEKIKLIYGLKTDGYSPAEISNILDKVDRDKAIFNFGQVTPVLFILGLGLLAYINRKKLLR